MGHEGVRSTGTDALQGLDELCRAAIGEHRADAFDNVDVARLAGTEPISGAAARRIARHLMLNGRSLGAYEAGQRILAAAVNAG